MTLTATFRDCYMYVCMTMHWDTLNLSDDTAFELANEEKLQ
jgi:hypothetical protein